MKTFDWEPASGLSHGEWRERLQAYIRLGDRRVEPVFVGRKDLFDAVADRISQAAKDRNYGSLTTIIGGAPGAGKSAFVAECMRRHADRERAVPLRMEVDRMKPREFVRLLADALDRPLAPQTANANEKAGAFSMVAASGEYRHVTERTTPSILEQAAEDGPVPWNVLVEEFGEKLAGRPILLFVDEAQTFEKAGNPHHAIPRSLHEGARDGGVPIIPVYAGLADTGMVLHREAGLMRTVSRNAIALAGLDADESRQYVREVLREYLGLEARADQAATLYEWMVREGANWPQHLRTQLEAVAECMLDADSRQLSALDAERLRETVERSRDAYYAKRAKQVARGRYIDVARELVMQADAQDGCAWRELEETAHTALSSHRHAPSSERYIDEMIHAGLLQEEDSDSDRYRCPIPSMYKWFERGGRHQTPPIPRMAQTR